MSEEESAKVGRFSRKWAWTAIISIGLLICIAVAAGSYVFRPLPLTKPASFETLDASAQRGEYLATIGNCVACHTRPGGEQYAGGVKFETPFGRLYSTNITADPVNGIGKWTFEQFHAAMKHGVRPDGTHLYPAFPYTSFAKLTDADVASLYLHFRTVPAVAQANRANAMPFPFNNRALLHFWKRLFHDPANFEGDDARSDEWNRGAYLVEGIAHCGACHTPRNLLGGSDEGRALQGGVYTDQVASGAYRKWSTADLTPGAHGLEKWSGEDIALYLLEGQNQHTVIHGPMAEVFASTKNLTRSDALAIGTYLKGTDPSAERLNLSMLRPRVKEGELVYTVHCGTCHLPDGGGDKILGVSLQNNGVVQSKDPASLINVILYGPERPPPPFVSNRTRMNAFGKRLSDEDVAAVATYLRSSFDNNASAVSPGQVAEQR